MAIVFDDVTIPGERLIVSNANGDALTVSNGDVVVLDYDYWTTPTATWGPLTCITEGQFIIRNNSTTTPLIFQFASFNNDARFEANGVFNLEGGLIEIGTGTGLGGQTIDFSNIGGVSINWPSAVWVEETPGGELYPFLCLGDPSADFQVLNFDGTGGDPGRGQTGFGGVTGSWDMSRFFTFNESTRVATFGNGTNGAVIPDGCKIYFPNIHFTSQKQTVLANKTLFDLNPTGTLRAEYVNFSRDIYFQVNAAYQSIYFKYVGLHNPFGGSGSAGPLTLDHVAQSPTTDSGGFYPHFNISNVSGIISIDHFYSAWAYDGLTSASARSYLTWANNPNVVKFDNFYCNILNKRNSTTAPADAAIHTFGTFSNLSNITLRNWTLIGGGFAGSVWTNVTIEGYKHSASPFAMTVFPPNAKWQHSAVGLFNISNTDTVKITGVRQTQEGTPVYIEFGVVAANSKNTEIYDVVYPTVYGGNTFLSLVFLLQSPSFIMKNCTFGLIRTTTGFFTQAVTADNVIIENVRGEGTATRALRLTNGMQANFVSGTLNTIVLAGQFNSSFALAYTDTDQVSGTAGRVHLVFAPQSNFNYTTFANGAFFNNAGRLYLPRIGSQAIIETILPLRGITGFATTEMIRLLTSANFDNFTQYTHEIEFANAGEEFTGNWVTLTSRTDMTPVANAFAALTGYDLEEGLRMRIRITANIANNTNSQSGYSWSVTVDPTWEAYDAYFTFEGGSSTDKYEMRLLSDSSVIMEFIGVGRHDIALGALLNQSVYFVRFVLVDGNYERTASTKPTPIVLKYGNNGNIKLYMGNEVQVASSDIEAIWSYASRTLTEGFSNADRAQLNKTLTSGKFLALK
jgi:hypothetical protein